MKGALEPGQVHVCGVTGIPRACRLRLRALGMTWGLDSAALLRMSFKGGPPRPQVIRRVVEAARGIPKARRIMDNRSLKIRLAPEAQWFLQHDGDSSRPSPSHRGALNVSFRARRAERGERGIPEARATGAALRSLYSPRFRSCSIIAPRRHDG